MNMLSEQISNLHSKIRDIEFSYDNLIVGSNLNSLIFCYKSGYPIIFDHIEKPLFFDKIPDNVCLKEFGIKKEINQLGLWERLFFYLSLSGQLIYPESFSSIRIIDSQVRATTPKARMLKINFNNLHVFNHENIFGINYKKINSEKHYKVYDYFDVRSGMKHDFDLIQGDDNFVKEIMFYKTNRVDGNHDFKDAISISLLNKEDLDEYEFSDINARFKTIYMMKSAGIRGTRNGRDQKDKTKYKYYAIKLENRKRLIIPPKNFFQSYDGINFNSDSISDIMSYDFENKNYVSKIIL